MKHTIAKHFLVAAVLIGFMAAAKASVVVVSPSNMNGWSFWQTDDVTYASAPGFNGDSGQMVTGPATPPLGTGSANLSTTLAGGNGASRITTAAYDGQSLYSFLALGYSTYVTANNGQQFPYMEIAVSLDGTGSAASEDSLFFEPPYQSTATGGPLIPNQGVPVTGLNTSPSILNQWQTWNALEGGWEDNDGYLGSGGYNEVNFLSALQSLFPAATIMNNNVNGGDGNQGITLLVGEDGSANNGYVDNVTINSTTFDFEPDSAVPEPTTIFAGMLLLLPLGLSTFRLLRKRQMA